MIFLGVDIGSTGSRCVAYQDDGIQLAECYQEYQTAPGEAALDPYALRSTLFQLIEGCVSRLNTPNEVAAVSVSSFGESFVALDNDGAPLSKIIMYYAVQDQSGLNQLNARLGAENIAATVCAKPDTMYSLPKMMSVRDSATRPIWKFLQMADYAVYLLSGETVTDYALACRTMAFDVANREWWQPILDAASIDKDQLATPVPTGTIAGTLLPSVAAKLGLSPSVQVIIGSHDQVAAAIGSGVHLHGQAVIGTGTVECITPLFEQINTAPRFTDSNFVCVPYLDKGYVTYGFNMTGGALVRWYRDRLALHLKGSSNPYAAMNDSCAAEPTSLLVVPHFQGAGGTPDMVKTATGTITGLTMSTTHGDIYRAILEGLSFELAYNLENLRENGVAVQSLRATGGGARSPIWLQIKSDILGLPLTQVKTEETGAMASAMLAAVALGCYENIDAAATSFVKLGQQYQPESAYISRYAEKFEAYKELRAMTLHQIWK